MCSNGAWTIHVQGVLCPFSVLCYISNCCSSGQDEKKKNKKKGKKNNRSLNRSHSTTTTTTTQEWVKNLPHPAKVRKSLRISPQNVKHPPFTSALRHPTEHPTGRLQSKYQEQKEGVILILVSCGTFLQSTFHSLAGHRQTMTLH
jgi:hypothetical protein